MIKSYINHVLVDGSEIIIKNIRRVNLAFTDDVGMHKLNKAAEENWQKNLVKIQKLYKIRGERS